ncbi:hypothetical protein [Legionella septentrionalis]|uniref:Uncharacterized protein n=1 Tax=Legionella septentrionalis TaxID=2498109 RepID=A0A3S0WSK4_9GAMM|nr:hypothetical protein [Legionella septentrionalis]RUQ89770.1 hypothetical protein EKM59_03155 [Legionella septentrionalis]
MRQYYENWFIRFLRWPKEQLFGLDYHYWAYGNSYAVEKRAPIDNFFYKIPLFFLYLLFNPIAFIVEKINHLLFPLQVLNPEQQALVEHNDVIADSQHDKLAEFHEAEKKLFFKVIELQSKFTCEEDWKKPELLTEFSSLFKESARNFLYFIHAVKDEVNKKGMEHVADSLLYSSIRQSQNLAHEGAFSAFVELYHFARSKACFSSLRTQTSLVTDKPSRRLFSTPVDYDEYWVLEKHPEFLQEGTLQNSWRLMFNTCVELFEKEIKPHGEIINMVIDKRGELVKNRFFRWFCKDEPVNSNHESPFIPYPLNGERYPDYGDNPSYILGNMIRGSTPEFKAEVKAFCQSPASFFSSGHTFFSVSQVKKVDAEPEASHSMSLK